jgi:hypothetical protein
VLERSLLVGNLELNFAVDLGPDNPLSLSGFVLFFPGADIPEAKTQGAAQETGDSQYLRFAAFLQPAVGQRRPVDP